MPGAGLGLAIVGALAEAHGGSAELENLPGGGPDARIVLPSARAWTVPKERVQGLALDIAGADASLGSHAVRSRS